MLAALTASISPALDLCIKNEAGLDVQTLMLVGHNLRQHQQKLGVPLRLGCSESAVQIAIRSAPEAGHPADALGATRVSGGRILPVIYVFAGTVRSFINCSEVETHARAMALVLAHELSHFVRQETGHGEGLDKAAMDVRQLVALN